MGRILKIATLTLLGLLLAASLGLWLGQDWLIGRFVVALNQHLAVPVRASRLDVSVLDQFPRLSLTLHDVVMQGSRPTDTTRLLRARRLYCAFDALDLLRGHYRIRRLTLADGQLHLRRDAAGQPNYLIIKPDTATTTEQPFVLELRGIRLERVRATYDDAARQQFFALQTPDLRATVRLAGPRVEVAVTGPAHVETVRLGTDDYFLAKEVRLNVLLDVDRAAQLVSISPSTIAVGPATYSVSGTVDYAQASQLNLQAAARQADLQAVLALLPPRLTQRLAGYRSQGQVYFEGTVRGEWSEQHNPAVEVRFGCRQASFFHPEYHQQVEGVSLAGQFSNGAGRAASTAVLTLRQLRGQLAGKPFGGSLRLENLVQPTLQLELRAELDVARALQFFPVSAVRSGAGEARLHLALNGPLATLRRRPTAQQARGELVLRGVRLQLRDFRQPFTGLAGQLDLRGSDIAVPNMQGRLGNSDFRGRGTVRNATGWALGPGQPLRIEASIISNLLDFNQLLYAYQPAGGKGGGGTAPAGGLHVPARLVLDLKTQARQVRYRRLRGRQLRGTLRLQNQVFSSPGLSVTAAGGQLSVRGTVDARQPQLLKARTVASCQQVPLDSLFYVFEDFGQHFLTSRHLRGRLTASAESDTYFDGQLRPLPDRLEAQIKATVRQGELLNFEPLQKLSLVADRATLRHLRFAELHNDFYIQSRTVYIPEMEIRSNVRAAALLRITGTHTFDQQLDYHLRIPLLPGLLARAAARADGPTLRLGIRGTESNFTVRYETGLPTRATPPSRTPATGPAPATPAEPTPPTKPRARPSWELKKPVKKPAEPQTGDYFEF
ncbi:AsmA-like C-terminal region-containing protein [Hymenobacter psychrophilus]|uniref:AsmA-like C-terminal region n=1 Tax=Hymenobacter psychrophilus TaxID=651662 RepID=A0A1H3IJG3_9BACT|nr:AsmA-like C-terminal region-containing protein [Hymenobacter psychrophilus]SDY27926.1 AsmA-like C-terminal region [Hymenobacter psychrophilus]